MRVFLFRKKFVSPCQNGTLKKKIFVGKVEEKAQMLVETWATDPDGPGFESQLID